MGVDYLVDKSLINQYAVTFRLSENITREDIIELNKILNPYGYSTNTNVEAHPGGRRDPMLFYSIFRLDNTKKRYNVVVHTTNEFAEKLSELADNLLNDDFTTPNPYLVW